MPKTEVLTTSGYAKLVADIRRIIAEGRERAAKAASQELVQTYWEVGRRICQEGLADKGGYGESILADLAEELEMDESTLLRCIHLSQTYKSVPGSQALTWSHYKVLLPLTDDEERQWYEKLVEEEGLTVPQLTEAVKKERFEESQTKEGKKVKVKTLTRPTQAAYVYKALVERVIDGDTLLLRVDLGFTVWKEQRFRLAAIDCPALDEPGGREAFGYVRDQMAKVDFVMVKTSKIDIYGRYVAHVFYSLKTDRKDKIFSEGRYLNQELAEKGLAKII